MNASTEPRTRAVRHFESLSLDRDALDHFFARAEALVPGAERSIEVRDDAGRSARFRTVDELINAPHLPTRLTDVALVVASPESAPSPRRVAFVRGVADDRPTLSADGDEVWAAAAVSLVGDAIDVYAVRRAKPEPPPMLPLGGFGGGFALAGALAIAAYRGVFAGIVVAIVFGLVWFALDFIVAEIRLRFVAKAAPPLELDLVGERALPPPDLGLWRILQLAALAVWIPAFYLVLTFVVPHTPR